MTAAEKGNTVSEKNQTGTPLRGFSRAARKSGETDTGGHLGDKTEGHRGGRSMCTENIGDSQQLGGKIKASDKPEKRRTEQKGQLLSCWSSRRRLAETAARHDQQPKRGTISRQPQPNHSTLHIFHPPRPPSSPGNHITPTQPYSLYTRMLRRLS